MAEVIAFAVRCIVSAVLLAFVYKEAGPYTVIVFACVLGGLEMHGFILRTRLKFGDLDRPGHWAPRPAHDPNDDDCECSGCTAIRLHAKKHR